MNDVIDFRDPAYRTDPYPILARARELAPVHETEFGTYFALRHQDVHALNRDPRLGRDLRAWLAYPMVRPWLAGSALEHVAERWLLGVDGDVHRRLRGAAAAAFDKRATAAMTARIERLVDDFVARLPAHGDFELVSALARPFPLQVILDLLGFDASDELGGRLERWSVEIARSMEPLLGTASRKVISQNLTEMSTWIVDHLGAVRPGLIEQWVEGASRLEREELVPMIVLMIVAGHETTTNLIANGVVALLEHRAELARLVDDPSLVPSAVEELLRFDGPTHVNGRVTLEEISVNGATIPAGRVVLCMLGAANRDPRVFVHPDRLDVSRNPNPHVTFGGGAHYCLGAPLARLEARAALQALLPRLAQSVVKSAQRHDRVNVRGYESVVLGPPS